MKWRGPRYPGEVPTLGWLVLDWITEFLAAPDRSEYEPLVLTREQAQFVLNFYALDSRTGKRIIRRAVYSRPKGSGKSPLLAAIACVEALGPVVPDGWDAMGEPVGRPWADYRTPWVQLAAVSEDQTRNAWTPLLEMLRDGPVLDEYPGLEPMETFVNLPKGRLEFVTSAATSREGNRPVFVVLDQTEEWKPSNGGKRLAATMRRNLGKTGGSSVESPNAYEPGADSVAEDSAEFWRRIMQGRTKDAGLLYDHREAPAETDMGDRDSLLAGLAFGYGDSAEEAGGWVDLDRLVAEIWDPATDPQDARRFYLNQVTHASDSFLSQPEWAACAAPDKLVADRDVITLGFDGSEGRARGVADATALIGCRISDGHLFELGVWEQPAGVAGKGWTVPAIEVDSAVAQAFNRYTVVAFYADPAKWGNWVSTWEAKYHRKLKVKASRDHPCRWNASNMTAVVRAVDQLHTAIVTGELTHDGSYALTRHMLNARRRQHRTGIYLGKEHNDSARKIDAAYASILAWQARLDAIAAGVGMKASFVPRRLY